MHRVYRFYSSAAVLFILLFFASSSLATWNKIANLNYPVGCCFFFDDTHGFAGSGNQGQQLTLQIWRTVDGGNTWLSCGVPTGSGQVTQISIRASDGVGYASIFTTSSPFRNLWKTTDGGLNWFDISAGPRRGMGAGVSSAFFGTASWANPIDNSSTNGVFFMDDTTMMLTPGPKNNKSVLTTPRYSNTASLTEAWSAFGDSVNRIWYAITELSGALYYSSDDGQTWIPRAQLTVGTQITGHIYGKDQVFYAQTVKDGMMRSSIGDTAKKWVLVNGPSNVLDTRDFYVGGCRGEMVIAFDVTGIVYKTTDGGDGSLKSSPEVALTHPRFPQISSCKNEQRDFVLTNLDCYDYILNSIKFVTNTGNKFSLTLPTVPDTIKSGATAKFNVLFDPQKNYGPYNARVAVNGYFADGLPPKPFDSLIDIAVTALAEPPSLVVAPLTIDFDTATICGGQSDSLFTMTNTGCDTVTILSGPGQIQNEFTVDSPVYPLRLPPDSTISIRAHFKPISAGQKQTYPVFTFSQQGVQGSSQLTFNGFAEDGTALMVTKPSSISFDTVTVCDQGDSALVTITNTGCVALLLDSVKLAGDPAYTMTAITSTKILQPHDTIKTWVHYNPLSKGSHKASISIGSHSGSVDSTVMRSLIPLDAFVRPGRIQIASSVKSVDLGTMTPCQTRDSFFTISNTGCDTLKLASLSLTGAGFSLVAGPKSDTILPGRTDTIRIHAGPDASGATTFNGTVTITSNSDLALNPIPLTFSVSFTAKTVRTWLTIDNNTGIAGSTTTVHLKADPSIISQFGTLDVTITHNDDLLGLLGNPRGLNTTLPTTAGPANTPASFRVTGNPKIAADPNDSSIALFDYGVFLTRDTTTDIVLGVDKVNDTIPGSGPCTILATASGTSFTYTAQCADDLIQREMRGENPLHISSIEPNPTGGDIDVEVQASLGVQAQFTVFTVGGVTVLDETKQLQDGKNVIHLATSTLQNGTYVLRVKTASGAPLEQLVSVRK